MKRSIVVIAGAALACGVSSTARADSRVSFEVGGLYAYSPLGADAMGGTRSIDSAGAGTGAPGLPAHDGIVGLELRPVFSLPSGARIAFGFLSGSTGGPGGSGYGNDASVVGGDVSVGFARRWGRVLPFVDATFGFNEYTLMMDGVPVHPMQLRLDGVVGAKLYVSRSVYVTGSAFAGWGDRYGATVALGFDIVRYRDRGPLP